MSVIAPALGYALLLWWASTGLILWIGRKGEGVIHFSMGAASAFLFVAVWGVVWSADRSGPGAMYAGFASALMIWGWHEMIFLFGYLTGSRRTPCPPGVRGWTRFRLAAQTVMRHEVALALNLVILVAMVWGQENPIAACTFGVLWAMRLSAKLNIFFGVAQFSDEFLPKNLIYLRSYFGEARGNAFYPFALGGAVFVAALIWSAAGDSALAVGERTGWALLGGLLSLAIVEHVFLVVPIQDTKLWRWILPADPGAAHPPCSTGDRSN
ncbi:MAG: putative photosynthetic complex assembly protein PuhE [Maricaulaceae bacterium]